MPQQARQFEFKITRTTRLDYLLSLPADYEAENDVLWPLILFLHGSGERGHNLDAVKQIGLPKRLEEVNNLPFVVVSPQCPKHQWWEFHVDALLALLDHVTGACRIDPRRVYLTGLSMGGAGAWYLAWSAPERFAAVAPICGRLRQLAAPQEAAGRLKHMPIWVFHGAQDTTVPLMESEVLINALRDVGNNVRFTVYPDAGHDAWTPAYADPELYTWFLEHTL